MDDSSRSWARRMKPSWQRESRGTKTPPGQSSAKCLTQLISGRPLCIVARYSDFNTTDNTQQLCTYRLAARLRRLEQRIETEYWEASILTGSLHRPTPTKLRSITSSTARSGRFALAPSARLLSTRAFSITSTCSDRSRRMNGRSYSYARSNTCGQDSR